LCDGFVMYSTGSCCWPVLYWGCGSYDSRHFSDQ